MKLPDKYSDSLLKLLNIKELEIFIPSERTKCSTKKSFSIPSVNNKNIIWVRGKRPLGKTKSNELAYKKGREW